MLRETGRVDRVQDGFAWVVCASRVDCRLCAEGRGCGGGILGRLLGDRLHRVRAVVTESGLSAGDRVELGLPESALVRGALQVYGIPLLGFLGLPMAFSALLGVSNDFALLGAALAGLGSGSLLAKHLAARGHRIQPVVTRKLSGTCSDAIHHDG